MKNFQHVFIIMMENTGFNTLIGNSNAPFINAAASNCGLATNYFGVTHPSQGNYIAATSGSTNGVSDDSDTTIDVANIVDLCGSLHQLEQHTQCLIKRPLPAGPPRLPPARCRQGACRFLVIRIVPRTGLAQSCVTFRALPVPYAWAVEE
jgi:hypothetical protein